MLFTVDALVAHAVGDYVLQSNWMATEKTKRSLACLAHVVCYTLPFLFLTRDPRALAFIAATHFAIDRWRLARYVCWAKNFLSPRVRLKKAPGFPDWRDAVAFEEEWTRRNWPWFACKGTGYGPDVPDFLAVWLLIIVDNLMHVGCNAFALWVWS